MLDLYGTVIDLLPPANLGEPPEDMNFLSLIGSHMGGEHELARFELPHVEVMHVHDSLASLEIVLDFIGFDVFRGGLEDDVEAQLGDGPGRVQNQHGEDVGGYRIQIVPAVELGDCVAVVRTEEENQYGGRQQPDALDDIG